MPPKFNPTISQQNPQSLKSQMSPQQLFPQSQTIGAPVNNSNNQPSKAPQPVHQPAQFASPLQSVRQSPPVKQHPTVQYQQQNHNQIIMNQSLPSQQIQQITSQQYTVSQTVQKSPVNPLSLSGIRQQSIIRYIQQPTQVQVQPSPITQNISQRIYTSVSQPSQVQPISVVHQQPTQMYLVERVEKPIQVVEISAYEKLWREKIEDLENKLKMQPMTQTIHMSDDNHIEELQALQSKHEEEKEDQQKYMQILREQLEGERGHNELQQKHIQELEQELKNLKNAQGSSSDQLLKQLQELQSEKNGLKDKLQFKDKLVDQLKEQIENLESENKRYANQLNNLNIDLQGSSMTAARQRDENEELRSQQQYYKELADERDQIINELQAQLEELRISQEEQTETTTSYLTNEVNTWKTKFIELNKQFHQIQEDLMLKEAELDYMKRQKSSQMIVTTTETKKTTNNSGSIYIEKNESKSVDKRQGSEYERAAINQNDIEKLKQLY